MDRLERFDSDPDHEYVAMAREEYGEDVTTHREAVLEALEQLDVTDDANEGADADETDAATSGGEESDDAETADVPPADD
jgi:hypothetical protein